MPTNRELLEAKQVALELQRRMVEARPMVELAMRHYEENRATVLDAIKHLRHNKSTILRNVSAIEEFRRAVEEHSKHFRKLQELLTTRVFHGVKLIAKHGWFPHNYPDTHEIIRAGELVTQKKHKALDKFLNSRIHAALPQIRSDYRRLFPRRRFILDQVVDAHNKRLFGLSVPLFLVQADGICNDILGVFFFKKRDGKPVAVKRLAPYDANVLMTAMFEPLRAVFPLSDDIGTERRQHRALNRHALLHGLDVTYPSSINSAKALSFLAFMLLFAMEKDDILKAANA